MSQQQGRQESPQASPKAVEKVGKQSMGTLATERGLPVPSHQDTATCRCFLKGPPGSVTGSTTRDGDVALPLSLTQAGPSLPWASALSARLGWASHSARFHLTPRRGSH